MQCGSAQNRLQVVIHAWNHQESTLSVGSLPPRELEKEVEDFDPVVLRFSVNINLKLIYCLELSRESAMTAGVGGFPGPG